MTTQRKRVPGRHPRQPRKPKAGRFAAVVLNLPEIKQEPARKRGKYLVGAIAVGIITFAVWPVAEKQAAKDDTFVMEVEAIKPPPKPPEPEPPPPKVKKMPKLVPPPPKQFGLQEKELAKEKSDLAVATGNTINKKADSIVAPPPPPLPPEAVMIDVAARKISGPNPVYPPKWQDRGVEGTVVALVTIDTTGFVTGMEISKGVNKDFDDAVLKAIRLTRFLPPITNGKRRPVKFRLPYEFRIDG